MPRFANVCLSERSYSVLCDVGDLELEISDFCVIGKEGEPEETGFIKSFEYRCIDCKEGAKRRGSARYSQGQFTRGAGLALSETPRKRSHFRLQGKGP